MAVSHCDLNRVTRTEGDIAQGRHLEEVVKGYIADSHKTGADSFFIESGAGSGKTTILARRIVSQLEDGVRPSQFAILTYTKEAADELRYKIGKYYPVERMHISTVFGFLRRILSRYMQEISPYALRDDQLALKALRLLEQNDEALSELREQYQYIYIDEFQDADSAVAQVLRLLAQDGSKEGESLRDGALFIVGDPRQSILHFKGYGDSAYLTMKNWMRNLQAKGCNVNVVTFHVNFRTDQIVLDWINNRFRGIIPEYTDMEAGRRSDFPIQGIWHMNPADYPTPDGVPMDEAHMAAIRIFAMMHEYPSITFHNFMIVTWDAATTEEYVHTLRAMGIAAGPCDHLEQDRDNEVRVMDVFASKGLAGDIVFLANLEEVRRQDEYWALQLEYVAVTRARHALVFAEPREQGEPKHECNQCESREKPHNRTDEGAGRAVSG